MRSAILLMVLVVSISPAAGFAAEGEKGADRASLLAQSESLLAARSSAKEFVTAFNRGDAKAVGNLWTADGEYVDENGRAFRGRESIEKEYAAFFARHPNLKLETTVSSMKFLNAHAAIEDGTSVLRKADNSPVSRASYTAFLLKEGGKWLMASVREYPLPVPAARPNFRNLDWLIGTWTAAKDSKKLQFVYRWIADKKFIELSYSAWDQGSLPTRSGIQVIGIDPSSGEVVSWSFDSNGGYGRGLWKLLKKGLMVESSGTLPDGASTASTDILSRMDDNSIRWQSVNRTVAGQRLNDSEPVVLKRKAQ
ncbi:YybH family protein [Desulfomonile tiedjei]|uniref:DUF4440 domain-containing protein n=1 Tax=Desulfomonile tiedjei (strain ATCC 49306 / DSM 6799 / DCB-1) TaxID=706587 RepID=I4C6I4_DESTA|nr:nuclear transport factor 2 family protein [Desulfomonile tiedjei]AFM25175.1 hypothetical protein Desti_2495 [Desulfomonile tiedjei DSM 6799]